MKTSIARRTVLTLAWVALPATVSAQSRHVEFEGEVVASQSPGFACGIFAVAGWATVRPARVLAGTLPPGDVRVVIPCGTRPVGEHLRVRGTEISTHAQRSGTYSIMPALPADGMFTVFADAATTLP